MKTVVTTTDIEAALEGRDLGDGLSATELELAAAAALLPTPAAEATSATPPPPHFPYQRAVVRREPQRDSLTARI